MLEEFEVDCPYCGEVVEIMVDPGETAGVLIEDCRVCCRPIEFHIERDHDGTVLAVHARRDDE